MNKRFFFTRFLIVSIVVFFLLALPFFFPSRILLTRMLIFGLFASAYNILFGYTRLVSFGHAGLFGIGSYATGLVLRNTPLPLEAALPAGVLTAAGFAWLMSYLSVRRGGVYCGMITLALAQLVYFIAFQWRNFTGGDDGLRGLPLGKISFTGINLTDSLHFYYFALIITAVALWVMYRMLVSPFGTVLRAIGENESRARACGYNTFLVKIVAFVISGVFSGLAGALYALLFRSVPIETLHWLISGEVVMMTLLGGAGTFFGPFIGAAIFCLSEDRINLLTTFWQLFVGCLFIVIILFAPKGLWGTLNQLGLFSRLKIVRPNATAIRSHHEATDKAPK